MVSANQQEHDVSAKGSSLAALENLPLEYVHLPELKLLQYYAAATNVYAQGTQAVIAQAFGLTCFPKTIVKAPQLLRGLRITSPQILRLIAARDESP